MVQKLKKQTIKLMGIQKSYLASVMANIGCQLNHN